MVKIATWNVNSVNTRLPHLIKYLQEQRPDVMLLQETKTRNETFPKEPLEDCGYNLAIHGQKSYNGVAILSKYPIDEIKTQLQENNEQARYIEAIICCNRPITVASIYVPMGQDLDSEKYLYKRSFYAALREKFQNLMSLEEACFMGGDYNVAPADIDVYDPKKRQNRILFSQEEKDDLRALMNLGYCDTYRALHPEEQTFSWWDYRSGAWDKNHGMRIDHILSSPQGTDRLISAGIDTNMRAQLKPSDHAPAWCEIED